MQNRYYIYIFTNSENSKTFDLQRLLLNLSNQTNLNGVINMVLYQNLAFTAHEKKIHEKSYLKTIHLRYSSNMERKISII